MTSCTGQEPPGDDVRGLPLPDASGDRLPAVRRAHRHAADGEPLQQWWSARRVEVIDPAPVPFPVPGRGWPRPRQPAAGAP